MKNNKEEEYVFYRMSLEDIRQANNSLKAKNRYKKPDVVGALIRDSIISYAKPFSGNRGIYKKRRLSLPESLVPIEMKETHDLAITYRDQLIAHNDLEWKNPSLLIYKNKESSVFPVVSRGFFYEELLKISGPLLLLSKAVLVRIEHEITEYENNF